MKKLVALILALTMVLGLCACGNAATETDVTAVSENTAETSTLSVTSTSSVTEESSAVQEQVEEIVEDADITGTYREKDTGVRLILEADGSAKADASIDSFIFGKGVDYHEYNFQYSVTGNTATIPCKGIPDEEFAVEYMENGIYLVSENCTFMPEEEFYKFEHTEICQSGDTVEAGDVLYTLESVGFTESINPNVLWDSELIGVYSDDYTYTAPDGMIYVKLTFNIVNNSKQALEPENVISPVLIYDDGFVFRSFEIANNYIVADQNAYWITGGGNSASGSVDALTIPSLSSHKVTAYVLAASAVTENVDAPFYMMLRVPDGDSCAVAAYDLRGGASEAGSGSDFCGTWKPVAVNTTSGNLIIEELEEEGLCSWSDWMIVLNSEGYLYLQTQNASTEGNAIVDETSITCGANVWNYVDDQLVLESGDITIFYEKVSDDQTCPSPTKSELMSLLEGTWLTSAGGNVIFSGTQVTIGGDALWMTDTFSVNMETNKIYFRTTMDGKTISINFDYTYDDGAISISQNGSALTKQQ